MQGTLADRHFASRIPLYTEPDQFDAVPSYAGGDHDQTVPLLTYN